MFVTVEDHACYSLQLPMPTVAAPPFSLLFSAAAHHVQRAQRRHSLQALQAGQLVVSQVQHLQCDQATQRLCAGNLQAGRTRKAGCWHEIIGSWGASRVAAQVPATVAASRITINDAMMA